MDDKPLKIAGLTVEVVYRDLVVLVEGIEISRTTVAEGIMQAEQLWIHLREAARLGGGPDA